MKTMQIAAVAAVMAGAAVGLAGMASADPPSGNYTGTMIDGGGTYKVGGTQPFTINPCGADCISVGIGGHSPVQMHRQGSLWSDGVATVDENTLIYRLDDAGGTHVAIQLTKNG